MAIKIKVENFKSILSDEILNEQKFKPVLHYNERMKVLISFPWLFVLVLIMFSTEWFVRKWLGLN